ncbi:MAG: hypothetical protein UY51_C0005G0074 [Candidatus Jorgensenbacteria bacterium GW2011_GWB1_49_9]|nr:MAG: hypothetical protein UY51_C0005G0074 [Candidatus Jorgensenbacteria bacterium GW2011_GWB1_49_9]
MTSQNVKIVVFVPETHAESVREAMGKAGAGRIGNYTSCSFSTRGIGRFRPEEGANPSIGKIGELEKVNEEKVEMVCQRNKIKDVINAVKKVHPYEEVALDVFPLEDVN